MLIFNIESLWFEYTEKVSQYFKEYNWLKIVFCDKVRWESNHVSIIVSSKCEIETVIHVLLSINEKSLKHDDVVVVDDDDDDDDGMSGCVHKDVYVNMCNYNNYMYVESWFYLFFWGFFFIF